MLSSRATLAVWRNRLTRTSWSSTRRSAKSCTWEEKIQGINTCWGSPRWKASRQKRTWGLSFWTWASSCTWPRNVYLQWRKLMVSWLALGEVCQKVKGQDPYPLLSTGESTPRLICPVLGSLVWDIDMERDQWRATKMLKGMEHLSCERRKEQLGLLRLKKEKDQGESYQCIQIPEGMV